MSRLRFAQAKLPALSHDDVRAWQRARPKVFAEMTADRLGT